MLNKELWILKVFESLNSCSFIYRIFIFTFFSILDLVTNFLDTLIAIWKLQMNIDLPFTQSPWWHWKIVIVFALFIDLFFLFWTVPCCDDYFDSRRIDTSHRESFLRPALTDLSFSADGWLQTLKLPIYFFRLSFDSLSEVVSQKQHDGVERYCILSNEALES